MAKPRSFRTAAAFRAWLEKNHAKKTELQLRLFKKHASKRGMGYRDALDEALCYGWIDGITHGLDEDSYTVRFTPRKKKSNWSAVNIKRVGELKANGRMAAPGLAAFEARDKSAKAPYSFEHKPQGLPPAYSKALRANEPAAKYWDEVSPGYKRTVTFWVVSAKKEETRQRRLETLIEYSARGKKIPTLG